MPVELLEPVLVALLDAVPISLGVTVALTETLPDWLRSDAKFRPRYTGIATLPSAASHELSADGLKPPSHPFDGTSCVMFDSNTQGAVVIVALVWLVVPAEMTAVETPHPEPPPQPPVSRMNKLLR